MLLDTMAYLKYNDATLVKILSHKLYPKIMKEHDKTSYRCRKNLTWCERLTGLKVINRLKEHVGYDEPGKKNPFGLLVLEEMKRQAQVQDKRKAEKARIKNPDLDGLSHIRQRVLRNFNKKYPDAYFTSVVSGKAVINNKEQQVVILNSGNNIAFVRAVTEEYLIALNYYGYRNNTFSEIVNTMVGGNSESRLLSKFLHDRVTAYVDFDELTVNFSDNSKIKMTVTRSYEACDILCFNKIASLSMPLPA